MTEASQRRDAHAPAKRRARLAALLVAVAAIAGPVEGAAAQAPEVRVRLGSRQVSLTTEQVRAGVDVPPTTYTLRDPGGAQSVELSGLSLPGLVRMAGGDPATVREVSLPRARTGLVRLSGADLADPTPFPDGPPLVFVDGPSLRFFRPVRGVGDVNAADNLATQPGEDLEVSVLAGPALDVRASADPTRARSRQSVTFSATVSGTDAALDYEWRFDDGTTAKGATTEHAFTESGRYRVVVTATTADGSGGTSRAVEVAVGERRAATARGTAGRGRRGGESPASAGERSGASGRDAVGLGRAPRTSREPSTRRTVLRGREPPARGTVAQARARRRRASRRREAPAAAARVAGTVLSGTVVAAPVPAPSDTRLGARRGPESPAGALPSGGLALALIAAGAAREAGRRPRRVAP